MLEHQDIRVGPIVKACKDCVSFEPKLNEKREFTKGVCHYNPPAPIRHTDGSIQSFPIVMATDWCREFTKKET